MPSRSGQESPSKKEIPLHTRLLDAAIEVAETILYIGIAALLSITAIALLVLSVTKIVPLFGDDAENVARGPGHSPARPHRIPVTAQGA